MSVNLVNLRNTTGVDQSVMVGPGYYVKAHQELVLSEDEARMALHMYKGILEPVEVNTIGKTIELDKTAPIWIANMSGDPDAEETVVVDKKPNRFTGSVEDVKALNMLATPRPYSIRWRAKTKRVKDGSATIELKPVKQRYTIPPYQRRPVDRELAKRMLQRASGHGPGAAGWIIQSREPTSYEPEASWSLDDMRSWLFMVDPRAKNFGKSEALLRKEATSELHAEQLIQQEKITMLKRCMLRVFNPAYTLPTISQHREFMGRDDVAAHLRDIDIEDKALADHIVETQLAPSKKKTRKKKASGRRPAKSEE